MLKKKKKRVPVTSFPWPLYSLLDQYSWERRSPLAREVRLCQPRSCFASSSASRSWCCLWKDTMSLFLLVTNILIFTHWVQTIWYSFSLIMFRSLCLQETWPCFYFSGLRKTWKWSIYGHDRNLVTIFRVIIAFIIINIIYNNQC